MTDELARPYVRGSAALIAFFALFRTGIMGFTGLGDSESYYWCWSQRLALSYYDHPPVVAWLIRLFTDIGGDNAFWVRMPSVILFIIIGWLLYQLARELFDDPRIAFYAILIFNLIPMFGIGALQMVPDIPAAACYLGFTLIISRLLKNNGPPGHWYLLGLIMGVGLLSKYFAILLLPCAMILVAVVPEYRHWYRRKEPYLMGLIALLVFMPVIYWNYANDWPSFRFQLVERHTGTAFGWNNFGKFVGGQFLYVSPILFPLLLWADGRGIKRTWDGDKAYALLTCFSVPTLLFFFVACAWTNESEPHWPAFGYLTASLLLAALFVEASDRWRPAHYARFKKSMVAGIGVAALMFGAFYIHVFHPILPIKPKYDIVNEIFGWPPVGKALEKEYAALQSSRTAAFILAPHWVLCSQIMFATDDQLPVACLNGRSDQFDFWDDESSLLGKTALVVTDNRFKDPPAQLYRFDEVTKLTEIPYMRGGVQTRTFVIWRGTNFQGQR